MSINSGMYSSATDAHNTPKWLVDKIADFFGDIALDPCTSESNPCGALRYFTKTTDGLSQVWKASNAYMNPPYGRGIGQWTKKLATEYANGNLGEAIALLPARTDTAWWATISDWPVCLVRGRLKFNDCGESAPFPSALIYLGDNWQGFRAAFSDIGLIYVPVSYLLPPLPTHATM